MATFAYRAHDSRGKRQRGTITAATSRQAREQLRTRGLRIESVQERAVKPSAFIGSARRAGATRYRTQLTTAVRELATLLQAGVPLLDALDSLSRSVEAGVPRRDACCERQSGQWCELGGRDE